MTPRSLLLRASLELSAAGVPDPETDASLLLSRLTGEKPLDLRMDADTLLSEDTTEAFEVLMLRRKKREPLQYILGSFPFQGFDFYVDQRVLIPRPETSLLVDWALECLESHPGAAVLDLCCGSGCIGLSVKKRRPDARVTLTDISPDALAVTQTNADHLDVEAEVLEGDLFASVRGRRFDLILSNPPYIPTKDCPELQREVQYEPRMALDGGADGLFFYRRIAEEGPGYLHHGGLLMMELGFGEAASVRNLLLIGGAKQVEIRKDFAGLDRMILAVY